MDIIGFLYKSNDYLDINAIFTALFGVLKLYVPDTLYKYYSLTNNKELNQNKLDTLQNNQIYLASHNQLNDPHDGKGYYYRTDTIRKYERLKHWDSGIIADSLQNCRIASFTANGIYSMPMWGNYANNHQGYCVSYDMRDERNMFLYSCTFPVQYVEKKINITVLMNEFVGKLISKRNYSEEVGEKRIVITDFRLPAALALLENVKHVSWSYENEYRFSNMKNEKYITAVPSAIYIGRNCIEENEKRIIEIAITNGIPVYKMENDDSSIEFWMKANRIG